MRTVILLLITTFSLLFAYQKGESISNPIVQKLGLQKDKIYVIDFFASWCGSCKKELPYISSFAQSQIGKNVEVIGIDVDENMDEGEAFQQMLKAKNALNFKVINDPHGEIIKRFNPIGMPAIYIVKNAKIQELIVGAKDSIETLLIKKVKALQ